ncbi:hypothetical protein A3D11_00385 [Candidatus Peribacteria bacterium RIFCSPHIGHO2_02_FULL_49_16]|nr:MAG: hypothetical protein A2880_02545 [Candidatus Peribacteria bacterium RIFCSPHIGHO2_01_FULL_49_38]OGJ59066.1 MAG: hypothetical protein A3D11_00385 [Candidatus Peribacteria bacterium RIFCSPHIGHO2_02_FULL_49_16]
MCGFLAISFFIAGGILGYTKRLNEEIMRSMDEMLEKTKPEGSSSTAGAPINLHDLPRAKPIWATGKQFLQRPGDNNRYCLSWWDGLNDPCSVKLTLDDPELLPTETEFYVLDKKDGDGNVIGFVVAIPAEHQQKSIQTGPQIKEETE